MKLTLEVSGPLDVDATLARYRIWGEDPVNRLEDGVFRRAVRLGSSWIPYEVRWAGPVDAVRLEVRVDNHGVMRLFVLDQVGVGAELTVGGCLDSNAQSVLRTRVCRSTSRKTSKPARIYMLRGPR